MLPRLAGDLGPPLAAACLTRALTRSLQCPGLFAVVHTASLTRSRAESSPGAADEPSPVERRRGNSVSGGQRRRPLAPSPVAVGSQSYGPQRTRPSQTKTYRSARVGFAKEPFPFVNINPQSRFSQK